jgi:Zn-dependent protease
LNELSRLIITLPALLIGVIFHEYAHGKVAELLGDPTARNAGRLSFNPIVHIDPFGSIILPIALIATGSPIIFGSAKPVPINPNYFKDPKRGMVYVGIAGPLANFVMAAIAGFLIKILTFPVIAVFLQYIVFINIILGVFNLIPIPPLDGSRIVMGFLKGQALRSYINLERYGLLLLFLVLLFFRNILWTILDPIVSFFLNLFL